MIRLANLALFGAWIKDVNCPFRLIKKDILDEFLKGIKKEVLAPNILISLLAKRARIKMIEVPVTHHDRKTGSNSLVSWKLIRFSLRGFVQLMAHRNYWNRQLHSAISE